MKVKRLLGPIFLVGSVGMGVACGSKTTASGDTYYYVTHGSPTDNDFWGAVQKGVQDAEAVYGVRVEYLNPPQENDEATLNTLLQQAIAAKPTGIAVTVHDSLAATLASAKTAGIPVIAINTRPSSSIPVDNYLTYVGQDDSVAATDASNRLLSLAADQNKTVTNAVCLMHENSPGLIARCAAFKALFGDADASGAPTTAIGHTQQIFDASTAPAAEGAYLDQHSTETIAVLSCGTGAASAYLSALQSRPSLEPIAGTFDSSPEITAGLAAGQFSFWVDQQQYLQGYMPLPLFDAYNRTGEIPPGFVNTGNLSH
jgi:simple sugar transport system substrate-binding protein